jgi:hypothetical protein
MQTPLGARRGPRYVPLRPMRDVQEDYQMNEPFFEAVAGLANIVWLMVITLCLFVTAPVWLLPYTVFKVWQNLRGKT